MLLTKVVSEEKPAVSEARLGEVRQRATRPTGRPASSEARPDGRPIAIYDGDCRFCRTWIDYWQRLTGEAVVYRSYQEVASQYPQLSPNEFERALQLVLPNGDVKSGAAAVWQVLSYAPGKKWLWQLYRRVPGWAYLTEAVYGLIARHRGAALRLTRLLWGEQIPVRTYQLTRWVFLRLLGIIYLVAFVSLAPQIIGLVGGNGVLPVGNFLTAVRDQLGIEAYVAAPTLVWFNQSDTMLLLLTWGGAALSLLVIAGIAVGPILLVLWLAYLSLTTAGQVFLSFQWDILLLEVGFLAIWLAPWRLWSGRGETRPAASEARPDGRQVPRLILWLLVFVLFKLLFLSGVVKLLSGDVLWRELTALSYHFETQPLPTSLAWWVHQLPAGVLQLLTLGMFIIELVVPFLLFMPRRLRYLAAILIGLLQVSILLTGNYTFFNWLTLVLVVLLFDDAAWRRVFPRRLAALVKPGKLIESRYWQRAVVTVVAVVLIIINVAQVTSVFFGPTTPRPLLAVLQSTGPWHLASRYGLFAVMTQPRFEIVVQGSADGEEWQDYVFRHKPQALKRAPTWVAPHQPRLDWQMWFAALGNYRTQPWFAGFGHGLLQGAEPVLSLLSKNPFPDEPPQFIRAQAYEYHFTDRATRRRDGTWWTREFAGVYLPAVSLENFRVAP